MWVLLLCQSGVAKHDCNCRCYLEYNLLTLQEFAGATNQSVDEVREKYNKGVENSENGGIIELTRKNENSKNEQVAYKYISDNRFNELTVEAKKLGAKIIRNETWFNERMKSQNASAITYGDVIAFGENVTVSDVLEETYHFKQNLQGLNADKPNDLRVILNEIDAKQYLIENSKKYKIPNIETELTKKQLEEYKKLLTEWSENNGY